MSSYEGKHVRTGISAQRAVQLLFRCSLISIVVGAVVGVGVMLLVGMHMREGYLARIEQLQAELNEWSNIYDVGVQEAIRSTREQCSVTIDELKVSKLSLEQNIVELETEIESLQGSLIKIQEEREGDFEFMRKFWYVFRDAPANSGLTLELLRYVDEQGERFNVNPHLLWGVYDVESSFNIYADSETSSARGLGQAMHSSAKSIYEDILGYGAGTYEHIMAYDPFINVEITACMIGRNLEQGLVESLSLYGDGKSTYPQRVIDATTRHGVTITASNRFYPT